MKLKGVIVEDFCNYKKASMFLIFPSCSFKCDKDCGRTVCQNSALANEPVIDVSYETIEGLFLGNNITESIVCGGLEPFDSWDDLIALILNIRYRSNCDIVIYTGYNKEEISKDKLKTLACYGDDGPIIIKWGRFIPDRPSRYDEVLGVTLASDNQYAERLTWESLNEDST